MTKVIFFDAGWHLVPPYPSVGAVYAKVAAKHGVQVDAEHVEKAFHDHWHKRNGMVTLARPHQRKNRAGMVVQDGAEMCSQLPMLSSPRTLAGGSTVNSKMDLPLTTAEDDRMPFKNFDAFFQELYDLFAQAECWRLFDDTIPTLEVLKKRGVHIAIISNWDHRLFFDRGTARAVALLRAHHGQFQSRYRQAG